LARHTVRSRIRAYAPGIQSRSIPFGRIVMAIGERGFLRMKKEDPSSPLPGPSKPGCPLYRAETHSLKEFIDPHRGVV
jgi:hypothetical protein